MKRRILALLLILLLLTALTSCTRELHRYEAQFLLLFDTVTKMVAYSPSKELFSDYAQQLYDRVEVYHQLYDIYNDYAGINNIKTINDNAGVMPVMVDQKIIDLLLFSKEEYEKTNGRVNVAFGAVLKIWHDYRTAGLEDPENASLPPMEDLLAANAYTDIDDVVIDTEASTVYLKYPGMSLDVGAIAKGYALEQVARSLAADGLTNAMISLGGNVRAIGGKNAEGGPFQAGIQNPDDTAENVYLHIMDLKDMSLVTSGNYERYYTVDGRRYHHIIDPQTLYPSVYFTAVTILTADSGVADALSTAVYNMPLEEGLAYVNALDGAEALWMLPSGELRCSDGFESYITEK